MIILAIGYLACLAVFLELAGRAPSEGGDATVGERSPAPRSVVDADG